MSRRTTAQQNPFPRPPAKAARRRTAATRRRTAAARRPATRPAGTPSPGGLLAAILIVLITALLFGHRLIPNGSGFGSLVESFLPWLGAPLTLLGLVAMLLRSRPALIATGCAVLAWFAVFGATLLPRGAEGPADLRVVSHNVYAANPDPAGTARNLLAAGADVIALQEIAGDAAGQLHTELDAGYRYRQSEGTLAVWSKFPLRDVHPVDVGMGWVRALRMTIDTPKGAVGLYVVHLASIRLGADGLASQRRDATLRALAEAVSADPARRLVLAGDLNTASTDRSLGGLTGQLTEVQATAGTGFGFTWPTQLPMVRLDHVLSRGLTVTGSEVLGRTGSDHRPVQASFRL